MTKDEALKMAIEVMTEQEPNLECNHGYHHNQCPNNDCECKEKKYWKALDVCKKTVESYFEIGIKSDFGKKFVYSYRLFPDKDGLYWMLQSDLKEALSEQPTQEPVAHIKQGGSGYPVLLFNGRFEYESITAKQPDIPLYTHPKQWQGLSDDEIEEAFVHTLPYEYGHAIEAKLKEKNS